MEDNKPENLEQGENNAPALVSGRQERTNTEPHNEGKNKAAASEVTNFKDLIREQIKLYFIPVLAIMITAVFFFVLGRKSNSSMQQNTAHIQAEKYETENAAEPIDSEEKFSNTESIAEIPAENSVSDSGIKEKDAMPMGQEDNAENGAQDINSHGIMPVRAENLNSKGPWVKNEYSKEILEIGRQQMIMLSAAYFPEGEANILHQYADNHELASAEFALASKAFGANDIAKNGSTPLISATFLQDYDMCRLLLAYGADPNLSTSAYPQAFALAIGLENKELVRLFLDNGANPMLKYTNSQTGKGFTPMQAAQEKKNKDIIEMLEKSIKDKK